LKAPEFLFLNFSTQGDAIPGALRTHSQETAEAHDGQQKPTTDSRSSLFRQEKLTTDRREAPRLTDSQTTQF